MIEILALFNNYFYILMSFLIGYILWHKIYGGKDKKIKDNIDNQLEWINLSGIVLLFSFSFCFIVYGLMFIMSDFIWKNSFLDIILELNNFILIILFIAISMFFMNKENINQKEMAKILFKINIIFVIVIIFSSILIFSFDNQNSFFYIIFSLLLIALIFSIIEFNFKLKISKKLIFEEIYLFIGITIGLFFIFIVISIFLIPNNNFQNSFENKFICENYNDCKEKITLNYSTNLKNYNILFLENKQLNNSFKLKNIIFFENNSKIDSISINRKNELKFNESRFEIFNINSEKINLKLLHKINFDSTQLEYEREFDFRNEKNVFLESKYDFESKKLNLQIKKNISQKIIFDDFRLYPGINLNKYNCSFIGFKNDIISCSEERNHCFIEKYRQNLEIDESNRLELSYTLKDNELINVTFPLECKPID